MATAAGELVLTLKDGREIRQINEEDISGDVYFQFQRIAAKNIKTPDEGVKWLMLRLFTVDGKPLVIDHLTEKPPTGLGFRAVATLGNLTAAFVEGLPGPKTSSEPESSPDGD